MTTASTTTLEPRMVALYEAVLDDVEVGSATRVLDVGCGAGMFLRLAAQRGATVAGIDAAGATTLPYPDDTFDVVTGFNSFQLAADPRVALAEAGRVGRPGAPIVIATWGPRDQCEAAAYVRALADLLPPGTPEPFALSEPGALERFAARAGLTPSECRVVPCVWSFADEVKVLDALTSTRLAIEAIDAAGAGAVTDAVLAAVAPYRTSDGGYRIENVFAYVIAKA